jgi:spore coat polysaccharide biosynthesis protein SpsF
MPEEGFDRRLVTVLACRCNSTRLWGKPLQWIGPELTIVEQLTHSLLWFRCVADARLAIAEGPGQEVLVDLAERIGVGYTVGSEQDVLGRTLACARAAGATDVLRKTSEDPFFDGSMIELAWAHHVDHANDVTVLDFVPEGTGFEILTMETLERCDESAIPDDHEHIADYARFNQADFRVEILRPAPACQRMDLRLTVDNPEDLIVCRAVFEGLGEARRPIALEQIVDFLDARPQLTALVDRFVEGRAVWEGVSQRVKQTEAVGQRVKQT